MADRANHRRHCEEMLWFSKHISQSRWCWYVITAVKCMQCIDKVCVLLLISRQGLNRPFSGCQICSHRSSRVFAVCTDSAATAYREGGVVVSGWRTVAATHESRAGCNFSRRRRLVGIANHTWWWCVQRETCTKIKTTILWAAWSSRLKAWTAMHNELVMYVYAVNQNSFRLMILKQMLLYILVSISPE